MINIIYAVILIGIAIAGFTVASIIGVVLVPVFVVLIVATIIAVIREDLKGY